MMGGRVGAEVSTVAPLDGRRVAVLGAAGDVGEGLVRRLLAHGAQVSAVSRNADRLRALADRLDVTRPTSELAGDARARLTLHVADVGHPDDGPRLRDALAEEALHGVVVSLGGWRQGARVVDMSVAVWQEALDQSLGAHHHAARLLLPLVQDVSHGSYTLINGGAAQHPVPGAGAMCVAAAAQLMLKDVLAAEHQNDAVRVNTLLLATPVRTRSRPSGADGWISADDAGNWASYLLSPVSAHRGATVVLDARHAARGGLPAAFV